MPAHGYLVLAEDMTAFHTLFPSVTNYMGPTGFGFSGNGELLRLFDEEGMTVDTVHYDDAAPWPVTPDGTGPTLELINPVYDNALALSWEASCSPHGTPGEQNCVYVSIPVARPAPATVKFVVVPNPMHTSSTVFIDSERPVLDGTLAVYNLLGTEVMRIGSISARTVRIDRGNLPAGSYYFRFADTKSNITGNGKLIID
jgi:hypothetical protein